MNLRGKSRRQNSRAVSTVLSVFFLGDSSIVGSESGRKGEGGKCGEWGVKIASIQADPRRADRVEMIPRSNSGDARLPRLDIPVGVCECGEGLG